MKSVYFYQAKTYSTRILGHYLVQALPENIINDKDCQAELRDMLAYFDDLEARVASLEATATEQIAWRAENAELRQQLAYYAGGDGKGLEA